MNAMQSRSAKLIALAAGSAVAVAAAYAGYWHWAAGGVKREIAAWAAERRAAGWEVAYGEPRVGGFPGRIEVALDGVRIAGPEGAARWRWQPPTVIAFARPWTPDRIAVNARGTHRVDAGEGEASVTFAEANGDLVAHARGIRDAVLRFGGIEATLADGGRVTASSVVLHVQERTRVVEADSATGTGIAFDARALALPPAWQPPLGTAVDRVALDAVVTGRIDPRGALRDVLSRWRDGGGALEVKALAVDWQALKLRADGTFALDEEMQPQGAMTAEISGIDQTADALIAAGVINAQAAFAAKIANKALTLGGGPARLPLTIQKRKLYLGPVPLVTLKPVVWR
jgi:hypothetical protein